MLTSKRFLPSTHLLCAFEAAARFGSFTEAAQELNLTQSAVSRQIKTLEEQIGVQLFKRIRQKVYLTPAGESYAVEIREALRIITHASMILNANPQGGALNLSVLPTLGTRWLAPNLTDFLNNNPGIDVNLTTHLSPFEFNNNNLDAVIHFGRADWPGSESLFLMKETILAVCSPSVLKEHQFRQPEDLLTAPLLHISTRNNSWDLWFAAYDIKHTIKQGMIFDQFATIAQLAINGLGVALLPNFLISRELDSGELVPAINLPTRTVGSYHLIWPTLRNGYPPLEKFKEWLLFLAQNKSSEF